MTYFAYLDEFGHIGPYISRADPRYRESPVFGLAGFVLPADEVRGFGTWFFQRKCELLDFEIQRSGEHPAVWEKKGGSLFMAHNVTQYGELRRLTNRLFNKILGGQFKTGHLWTPQKRPFPAPETGVGLYFMGSCVRKLAWTLVRQLRGPHLSTCA